MAKLLLVSPRQGAEVAEAEHRDVTRAAGLEEGLLDHRMLDSATAELGELDAYAGIIVGGSPLHVTSTDPGEEGWKERVHREFDRIIAADVPSIFLCYGTGYVAGSGGGTVGLSHPEVVGTTRVELTAATRRDPLTAGLPPYFRSLTGHTENVMSVGPGTEVLATGPTCPVQMIRRGDSTWACQFHPDLDVPGLAYRMSFYMDKGYFEPEAYDAIVESLQGVRTDTANTIMANFARLCGIPATAGPGDDDRDRTLRVHHQGLTISSSQA